MAESPTDLHFTSEAHARELDERDPLARFRERFYRQPGVIYLDGNSLGVLPAAVPARVAEVVQREWGEGLIRSWNTAGWIDLADVTSGISSGSCAPRD